MRRSILVRFGACALLLLTLPPAAGSAAAQGPVYAEVSDVIEQSMAEHGVPGVGIALIDGFEVVWTAEFGLAEPGRPVRADTLFQAASLSKPTAAVIAAAADEHGMVDLEADALAMTRRWTHPRPWWDGPVTLRMLFAHRGGVNVSGFPGYPLGADLPELEEILDGVVDMNEPIRVMTQPGEHQYSGGGYQIAEMAIEDATGQDFETLADTLVFEPLGLELSTFRLLGDGDRLRVAVGYRSDGAEVAGGGWHLYPETAAGSMWTTAGEYATFVADVMRSYQTGAGTLLSHDAARLLMDPDFPVGFGVGVEPDGISIGHGGANEGYRTGFTALVSAGEGVVILTNSDSGDLLVGDVTDAVAAAFGWPGTGWSTPLWAVLLGLFALVTAATAVVRRRSTTTSSSPGRRRRQDTA